MRARDAEALHQLLDHIQGLPPDQNPVVVALNKIATVHFARFVFLDHDTKLAVITAYDGQLRHLHQRVRQRDRPRLRPAPGPHGRRPPLPVREHRQEFLTYITNHDIAPVGTFYSAYPRLSVLDILALGD